MARFSAILFLLLFSFTATELGQFLKLPVLVQHFNKHQKEEGLSFLDFLAGHYPGHHEDEDKQEDNQLPFKNFVSAPSLLAFVNHQKFELAKADIPIDKKYILLKDAYIPSSIIFQVFHPPRTMQS